MSFKNQLKGMIYKDKWMMEALEALQKLNLPQAMIASGFVRNKIWDELSGKSDTFRIELLGDIDVIYFDPDNIDEKLEKEYEAQMEHALPCGKWEIDNQARMHLVYDEEPYKDAEEALSKWPDTAMSAAVYLDNNNDIQIIAPYGLDDVFNFILRPTPYLIAQDKMDDFNQRISKKPWMKEWPQLKVVTQ